MSPDALNSLLSLCLGFAVAGGAQCTGCDRVPGRSCDGSLGHGCLPAPVLGQ